MAFNKLRTCTPEADWRTFKFTVPSGVTKVIGTLYLINDTWAMVFASEDNLQGGEPVGTSIAAGKVVLAVYNAEKILVPKLSATGSAIEVGEKVYVSAAGNVSSTKDGTYDTCIGICTESALFDDTAVEIDLKGDSMTDQG